MTTRQTARQQLLLDSRFNKEQLDYNNSETAGNVVFYSVHAKGLYNEDISLGAQNPCGGRVEYLHCDPVSHRYKI
jgi:hypothetical protein